MQTSVEEHDNAALRAFVVDVQELFMLEHMVVVANKPAENSTYAIVMFAVDHLARFNSLQGDTSLETLQDYVLWSGSRVGCKKWWLDADVREAAITWVGSGIKVDALQRATKKQEVYYQKWMSERKQGDVEPADITMISIARQLPPNLQSISLKHCLACRLFTCG